MYVVLSRSFAINWWLPVLLTAKPLCCRGLLCQVETNYFEIKALNPNLPFLVRAVDNITPNIVATYGASRRSCKRARQRLFLPPSCVCMTHRPT